MLDSTKRQCYKKKQSWYWQFFRRSVDAKSKVAVCLICHKEAGCKTPQNLNNHLQHWDRKHEGFKAAQARHSKKKEETNPVGP